MFLDEAGEPLRLNEKDAGGSGRKKIAAADWDGDGLTDLLLNSSSADWMRCLSAVNGEYRFAAPELLDARKLAGHTSAPAVSDLDGDGIKELLVGAEDGFLYWMEQEQTRSWFASGFLGPPIRAAVRPAPAPLRSRSSPSHPDSQRSPWLRLGKWSASTSIPPALSNST